MIRLELSLIFGLLLETRVVSTATEEVKQCNRQEKARKHRQGELLLLGHLLLELFLFLAQATLVAKLARLLGFSVKEFCMSLILSEPTTYYVHLLMPFLGNQTFLASELLALGS